MEDLFKHGNRICSDCGMELPFDGLMEAIRHSEQCLRNAPNESLEAYYHTKEIKRLQQIEKNEFSQIENRMTREEHLELWAFQHCGTMMYDKEEGYFVLMGLQAMKRVIDFKNKMKIKYKNL